jgi:hypothetical protein
MSWKRSPTRCNRPARGSLSPCTRCNDLTRRPSEAWPRSATDPPLRADVPTDDLDREARRRPGALLHEQVAEGAEDSYSGRGEAEGYWVGSAAADLGLDGKVDPEGLTAMLIGRRPASGEPLGLRHVAGRGPVPGFDLTFAAPKSGAPVGPPPAARAGQAG